MKRKKRPFEGLSLTFLQISINMFHTAKNAKINKNMLNCCVAGEELSAPQPRYALLTLVIGLAGCCLMLGAPTPFGQKEPFKPRHLRYGRLLASRTITGDVLSVGLWPDTQDHGQDNQYCEPDNWGNEPSVRSHHASVSSKSRSL